MVTMKKTIILGIIFLGSCFLTYAQRLPIRNYSIEDGMISSGVNRVIQDSRGYLWIATQNGLSRFDGINFRNFTREQGLPHNHIRDVLEDRHHHIWLATVAGLTCLREDTVTVYAPDQGLFGHVVYSLCLDREGNLWSGGIGGATRLDAGDGTPTGFTREQYGGGKIVYKVLCDNKGHVWLGTDKGLSRYAGGVFTHFSTTDGLPGHQVLALMEDSRNRLWIGTDKGAAVLDAERKRFTAYTTKQGLVYNWVLSFCEDNEKNTWIGTDRGISVYSGSSFRNITPRNGLRNKTVTSLLCDREGNIWFGTPAGAGCFKSLMFTSYSSAEGLPSDMAWSILEDREGRYWFGTDNGLSRYSGGAFTTYRMKDGLAGNYVLGLLEDRGGRLWIATDGGVSLYDGTVFFNFSTGHGLSSPLVYSLAETRDGAVYAGTQEGLDIFVKGGFSRTPYPALAGQNIYVLCAGRDGELWVGTTRGFFRVSGEEAQCFTMEDGLLHNNIYSLYQDGKGRVWAGTILGVNCYWKGKFTSYTVKDGLCHNRVCFFLEDNRGDIWIGTENGVSRFDGRSFRNYTVKNGLVANSMNDGACFKDSKGHLWFGTVRGLARVNPGEVRPVETPPLVYITGLKAMGLKLPFTPPGPVLKHDRNSVNLDFIGISLSAPEAVAYRYRLEHIDPGWVESSARSASYSFLPPGDYRFQVYAENIDGVESPVPAEVHFIIRPPFWKTWWFRLPAFILLVGLLALFLVRRDRRIKERAAFRERTRQLIMAQRMELLGVLAAGAVHDLKNLIGIIIGYSGMDMEAPEGKQPQGHPWERRLDNIRKAAVTAAQVVRQILSFARQKPHETTNVNLARLVDDIIEVLKITIPPGIAVSWEKPARGIYMRFNTARFQQVVMNLCLNAVQAMPEGGELGIRLHAAPGEGAVILEISDTGTGMDQETREKIFTPLYTTKTPEQGSGLGLFVVKQIVEEYRGVVEVRSEPGRGTTFLITFPSSPGMESN